ncbi:histone-lysine N-methyltransferase SETMAR [Battus philenor]|uniref:histone-lysine N-methyltransferase SETMAR n=1 Tax=Battus philenor TaxID=42288 RepID=UPI0035CF91C7
MDCFVNSIINMNDNYEHPNNKVFYIVENIPGPAEDNEESLELLNQFNSQVTYKCECKSGCSNENCCCVYNSRGRNYTFTNCNDLKSYTLYNDNKSIFECNSLCSCVNNCGNRLVQKGPRESLVVRTCEIKEKKLGLFTKEFIAKGSFICEYAGELITKSQVSKRHEINTVNKNMNFIFCLNEHTNGRVIQTFVDPSLFGNIGRYINHSCNANSHIILVRINSPLPKLAIFSLCDISPGQEITIDYGSKNFKSKEIVKDLQYDQKKCLCNSKNCRGYLPFDLY